MPTNPGSNFPRPLFLWENVFESGTLTPSSEEPGWPVENVLDWTIHTGSRWRADTVAHGLDGMILHLDAGAGVTVDPDTVVVGGHNGGYLSSVSDVEFVVEWSDNDRDWFQAATFSPFLEPLPGNPISWPIGTSWDSAGKHRWWRFRCVNNFTLDFLEKPQFGLITLGRALYLEGAPATFDWWGSRRTVVHYRNDRGGNLGSNLEGERFRVSLDFQAGQDRATWFEVPEISGVGFDLGLMPHVKRGRPFWFGWNIAPGGLYEPEADHVFRLVRADDFRMPFVGTRDRRNLRVGLEAYERAEA